MVYCIQADQRVEISVTDRPIILYIEDNQDSQQLVQRILGEHGYTVMLAEDGLSGIALAHEVLPQLILVDINIPGMDGHETTTRLRSMVHLNGTPIVALTADVSPEARERALVAGCDGFLTKPIRPQQLTSQVAEFIAGKRESVSPVLETTILRAYNQRVVERLEQRIRELITANAELQEGQRLRSQFLTSLSHELRTPLTSLLGYLDLFSRGTLGPVNDIQRDAIAVMQRNVETLSQQLNNLLYLQEYRSNPLALASVQLNAMIEQIVKRAMSKALKNDITLNVQECPIETLRADPSALELAITNLLDNAIKYTPPGGEVTLALRDEPSRVVLRLEDTGVGIPPAMIQKIFLPFFRVDSSLAGPQPGSGIGLALVQHIVEAHGGQVTVRSTVGEGSIFTMTLPRR
jgi:signal transduction histidine kinase